MTTILHDREEILDFVYGCSFFGTGGGGTLVKGERVLLDELEAGRTIQWTELAEIPDDTWTVCAFGMGSIAPIGFGYEQEIEKQGLGARRWLNYLIPAVQALERFTRKRIGAVIPSELGGSNTPGPVAAGAHLGLTVVDGDYTGRAVPEIIQHTASLAGKSLTPIASVDSWGNTCFIESVVSESMVERIGKQLGVAAFGATGLAAMLLPAREVKECALRGTLTEALKVGHALRTLQAHDPIAEAARIVNGWVLFRGRVSHYDAGNRGGYFSGDFGLEGVSPFQGHRFKIWLKNENHVSWFDDEVYVTSPDILAVVDGETARPLLNAEIKVGDSVAVVGVRAREPFRSGKGLAILEPRHFGFDMDYVPIMERVKQRAA